METTIEYKGEVMVPLRIREDAETVYDGRVLIPNQYPWCLTDMAGGVEPILFRVDANEVGWYRFVAQVKNRKER